MASVSPQSLNGGRDSAQYYVATLSGILLNAVEELPSTAMTDSAIFKAVIAGGQVQGRQPRGRAFTVRPRALHVFAANELPSISDTSSGFWRRMAVVPFEVAMERPRPDALAAFARERQGMLRWALDGAVRALARGRIAQPAASEKAAKDWRATAESVSAFLSECCGVDHAADAPVCTSGAAYKCYQTFCVGAGYKPVSMTAFGRRLANLLPGKKARGPNKTAGWRGLAITDPREWPVELDDRSVAALNFPPRGVVVATSAQIEAQAKGIRIVEGEG
ncbi:MAG: DUF5906 domain-containing protein [Myxococcota bacterium]